MTQEKAALLRMMCQELGKLRPRFRGPDRGRFSEPQIEYARWRAEQRLARGETGFERA